MCCWTGTGASIAANKVPGIRAALCGDAETAEGARKWNDANVLALSLRTTSAALLSEILDAWFAGEPSSDEERRRERRHIETKVRALNAEAGRCSRHRPAVDATGIASCRPSLTLDSHIDKTTLRAKTCAFT